MGDIFDAVAWRNLEALSGPVLGYADGQVSRWPPEALTALGSRIAGLVTVLADERCSIFDSETGNAGVGNVATAVANRFQAGLASTVYTNADNCPGQGQALRRKGIFWTDSQFWPHPGCYLWAAAPGTTPGRLPAWCPVSPVAVQDRWLAGYDVSTTFYNWPFVPAPGPHQGKEPHMMVVQFGQDSEPGSGMCLVRESGKPIAIDPADLPPWLAACGQTQPHGPVQLAMRSLFT